MFVVWDEADMPLGYYNTKEEAEVAFQEYCQELFKEDWWKQFTQELRLGL